MAIPPDTANTANPASEAPELGGLAAEYEILRELGRGGMAVVYLARHRASSRLVAIKTIRRQYVEDREAITRFAREARTVARLDHPNIVRTHAVEQLGERALAIVMEYIPGGTLRDAIRANNGLPFSYERTMQVLRDVGRALGYAHSQGIVHRDVKPENIFLDDLAGRALLSDFGVARTIGSETLLTMAGVTLGTPSYMSPEQIDGQAVDGRSDIYSLGLVGWELLAGKRPWEGDSLYSVIYKQKHEELPRITELRPDIPAPLLFAIEGAMHKHRNERWANAEEFLAQLSDDVPATPGVGAVAVIRQTPDIVIESARDRAPEPAVRELLASQLATQAAAPDDAAADHEEAPTIRLRRVSEETEPPAALEPSVPEPVPSEPLVPEPLDGAAAPHTRQPSPVPVSPAPPPVILAPPRVRRRRRFHPLGLAIPLAVAALIALVVAQRERSAGSARQAARPGALDTLSTTASGGTVTSRDSGSASAAGPLKRGTASGRSAAPVPPPARPAPATTGAERVTDTPGVTGAGPLDSTRASAPTPPPAGPPEVAAETRPTPRTHADSLARCDSPALADQRTCLYVHIGESDAELNRVYGTLIAAMRRQAATPAGDGDPPAVRQLRAEQRAWLVRRDDECRRRTRPQEGALWAPVRASCLAEMSDQRVQELKAALERY